MEHKETERAATNDGMNEAGKKKSRRPDTKARQYLKDKGMCINQTKAAGHVPGISVGHRYAAFLAIELFTAIYTPSPRSGNV
jgi:hypothetical protein